MGGRGSGSNMASSGSGLKNSVGASPKAVSIMEQAVQDIGVYGSAHIPINTTTAQGYAPKADNPKQADLESQITHLAEENGYTVSFDTKTSTHANAVQYYKYGSSSGQKTQTKQRIAHIWRK